ncbi:reverse transcriptase [Gossypium australe]|uniref:Reverse transcriptase n=1 Tax=Gossypium australe TaxID=47621 RepID=A0A5B6VYP7_9ROSI|nr:reverse transcriptase [Gossypium australe]
MTCVQATSYSIIFINKVSLSPYIYSSFVVKASLLFSKWLKVFSKEYKLVVEALNLLIYGLLTTIFFLEMPCMMGVDSIHLFIHEYESHSGQLVNFDKSMVFFSANTSDVDKKRNALDNILSIISGWNTQFLSQGRRVVLIKSILQSLPSHAMSCSLLPNSMCDSFHASFNRFWWQKSPQQRL